MDMRAYMTMLTYAYRYVNIYNEHVYIYMYV
jgi:hypothetical protein